MVSAPAWRLLVAARCWPTVAPRAVRSCRHKTSGNPPSLRSDGMASSRSETGAPPRLKPCLEPRLKKRAEFLRVSGRGRKTPMPGLVLQVLKRDDDAPARLGFTV